MIKLYRISENPERCPMCRRKLILYDFDIKNKFGDNLSNLTVCGDCLKKCHAVMEDFIDTMLRGEDESIKD